jgi:hypothetical protein
MITGGRPNIFFNNERIVSGLDWTTVNPRWGSAQLDATGIQTVRLFSGSCYRAFPGCRQRWLLRRFTVLHDAQNRWKALIGSSSLLPAQDAEAQGFLREAGALLAISEA